MSASATGFSSKCVVPRLVAAARNAANPCAPKNPSAAKNPCAASNPCAAKNPCAARKNPCNPCSAAAQATLTSAEATAVYSCLQGEMRAAYARSGNRWAKSYWRWQTVAKQPYVSATHGQRYVRNYASAKAAPSYSKFEKGGPMPRGGIVAKDSFIVSPQGRVSIGPLFLMEKMGRKFSKASHNWRYTMIMPNGQVAGMTGGKGASAVKFCAECHAAVSDAQDSMFFLPEEYRKP